MTAIMNSLDGRGEGRVESRERQREKIERVQNYRNILELVWFIFLFNKVQWTAINKYKIRKEKINY